MRFRILILLPAVLLISCAREARPGRKPAPANAPAGSGKVAAAGRVGSSRPEPTPGGVAVQKPAAGKAQSGVSQSTAAKNQNASLQSASGASGPKPAAADSQASQPPESVNKPADSSAGRIPAEDPKGSEVVVETTTKVLSRRPIAAPDEEFKKK